MLSAEIQHYLDSLGMFGWKLGLERMWAIADELGHPQKKFSVIHIAGSNGKGSVARLLESIYLRAGYRIGLYTSPHLVTPTERIRIAGSDVDEHDFEQNLREIQPVLLAKEATYFEALTLLAFHCFAKFHVELAIIEVGLGGRFDATNIVDPLCSIITSISLEHTDYLGNSLEKIAFEKSGIIKPGAPCIIGDLPPEAETVIKKRCDELAVELVPNKKIGVKCIGFSALGMGLEVEYGDKTWSVETPLIGEHQISNIKTALSAIDKMQKVFPCFAESIDYGLQKFAFAGRFQMWRKTPTIVLDVAHNPASMACLVESLVQIFANRNFIFLIGMLKDKDAKLSLAHLLRLNPVCICITPQTSRGLRGNILQKIASEIGISASNAADVIDAFLQSVSLLDRNTVLVVTGSHYVVGEFLHKQVQLKSLLDEDSHRLS
ncbi:MAG: bifunctional folylpolyglutamate synthase/dihydrofolate synthase [Deferribacteres bacterium]|nr:bifunctional folylpolyglutamate synthase/dihydrofolate synthase [candidate division KSB1 bacterium]MCB9504044.1 bifunctional folylpolyglutamate synthase/dihydrofolate synthase [Deferribacteres bacterium]